MAKTVSQMPSLLHHRRLHLTTMGCFKHQTSALQGAMVNQHPLDHFSSGQSPSLKVQ